MQNQKFHAPTFKSSGFAAIECRRSPEEQKAVATAFAARVAARRDERVMRDVRFGREVYSAFVGSLFVEGDAVEVMAALAKFDRRADPVIIRMSGKIDADYQVRDVFSDLPTGKVVTTTHGTASAMLEDARERVGQLADRPTATAYHALIRQLAEITA